MNLLFIFTDQQNRFALSCMGNPNVDTPNLDALAAKGVLFDNCYTNDPLCGPFRGSLITGQYTSTCGVKENGDPLPGGTTTFPEAFEKGGYATSWIGKWHLGGNGHGPIPRELQGGFQRYIGYQCYNGFMNDIHFYDHNEVLHTFTGHRTEITTDLAITELDILSRQDHPFMLMMSYQAPHYPEQPLDKYYQQYKDRPIIRRENCQDINPFTPTFTPRSPRPFEDDPDFQRYGNNLDEYLRLYYAMCTQIDADIGRLIAYLEKLGIADETMIFFTSDHGDMQGSHGLKNKCLPHEESAGIPFIAYVPGLPGGRISNALISGIDMMPTCLDLAGLDPVSTAEGFNFASLLRGETEDANEKIFIERADDGWCMIRKGDWKLVADRVKPKLIPTFLTNLKDDPFEKINRVDDPTVAKLQDELLTELIRWDSSVRQKNI